MTQHNQAPRNWRGACLFWFVLLTIATHLPPPEPTGNPVFESPDKLLHFVCFGMLGFLFMCSGWIRNVLLSWCIVALWAYVDEFTQDALPLNRAFSRVDLISGELGILAAYSWQGALQAPQLQHLKESIANVLASWKNWLYLGGIGAIVVFFTTGSFWFIFKGITGEQQSDPSFMAGILLSVIAVLFSLWKFGNIQINVLKHKKNMVLILVLTMGIAAMIAFAVPHTFVDTWVLSLFAIVLGCRMAWNSAT